MGKLLFGWSEISLTPDKKISLLGQFAERISQYVEKPVTATAMAVDSGNDQMVLVSCDLAGVTHTLLAAIRQRLAGNTIGLDPGKVIYASIHTHTSHNYPLILKDRPGGCNNGEIMPLIYALLPEGKRYVEKVDIAHNDEILREEEAFEFLADRLAQVALDAWADRKPGSFANGFGRAPIGMCRRACYSDGSAQMWGDTNTAMFTNLEGGNDSGIEVLFVFDEGQTLKGIVATIACPAQCVQHRHFISPDYWGEAKMLLRKHFGEDLFLVGLCSIAGDQCPVDLIRWVNPESPINDPNCERENPPRRKADPSMFDLAGMRKAGRRAANGIIDAWEDGVDMAAEEPVFEHRALQMQLPLRRVTLSDVARAESAVRGYLRDKPGDIDYIDVARLQPHLGVLRRAQVQEEYDTVDSEIHVIRMGNIAIATNPFEPYLTYGDQIKARSAAEQTFLVQIANGMESYIPTKEAEAGGHYSAYVGSGMVGHLGGEEMVRQTLQNIRDMFL